MTDDLCEYRWTLGKELLDLGKTNASAFGG
jgi:hypothetical protein